MKKRNLLLSVSLMTGLLAVAFTFDNDEIHWLWADNKPVAVILAVAAITLGLFWLQSFLKLRSQSQKHI